MITDRREFFRIRCQIRDHAGDSAGGAGSFETVDAVLGYHALCNRNLQKRSGL